MFLILVQDLEQVAHMSRLIRGIELEHQTLETGQDSEALAQGLALDSLQTILLDHSKERWETMEEIVLMDLE